MTLLLTICAACAIAGAQWGMEVQSKNWAVQARRLYDLERHHHFDHHGEDRPQVQFHAQDGELWVRTPPSSTWYNVTGHAAESRRNH